MNTYHIVYKEKASDFTSIGKNYIDVHPTEAILQWCNEAKYERVFISCIDIDALAEIRGGAKREIVKTIDDNISNLEKSKIDVDKAWQKYKDIEGNKYQ